MHIVLLTIAVCFAVRLLTRLWAAAPQLRWRHWGRRFAMLVCAALIVSCVPEPQAVQSHAQEPPLDASNLTDDSALKPSSAKTSKDQPADAVFFLITRQGLQSLLPDDHGGDVSRWQELRRAYAMIPLSLSGSSPLPSVLGEALSPAGVRILQQALSRIIALRRADDARSASGPALEAEANSLTDISSDRIVPKTTDRTTAPEAEQEPAEWVTNPGVGQSVVKSDFLEATIAPEVALHDPVLEVVKVRMNQLARQQFGTDSHWQGLIDISLSDQAVRRCIVSTDARTEVIETAEGPHSMRQTVALVEIPSALERQLLNGIEGALRKHRLITLCLAMGTLWLAVVFFSVACRATQSGSLLRKLATFPAMAFLIVPCLLTSAVCLNAMVSGQSLPFADNASKITHVLYVD